MGNISSHSDSPIDLDTKPTVSKDDFKYIKVIGQGAFAKVFMVKHRSQTRCYALKVIAKAQCIKYNSSQHILRERSLLERLDHPLVCNLRYAFHDDLYLYMAMDLMLGGDLRVRLRQRPCAEIQVQFWMAELACALRYLHSKGIVHRDVKPDNLLIDDDGHLHLTDFNVAANLTPGQLLTSSSGTPSYFAPEIVRAHGYNEAVDWWCMGITMYECIYGKRPWQEHGGKDAVLKQIAHPQICFPDQDGYSAQALCMTQSLLETEPYYRTGYRDIGWQAMTMHPFFQGISWNEINQKKSTPPVPSLPRSTDNDTIALDLPLSPPHSHIDDNTNKHPLATTYEPGQPSSLTISDRLPQDESSPERGWIDRLRDFLANDTNRETAVQQAVLLDAMKQQEELDTLTVDPKFCARLQELDDQFLTFAWTVYDEYEGFLDKHRRSVGRPPSWVKPAFGSADELPCSQPIPSPTSPYTSPAPPLHLELHSSDLVHDVATPPITPVTPLFYHQPDPVTSCKEWPPSVSVAPMAVVKLGSVPKSKKKSVASKYFNDRRAWERRKSLGLPPIA